MNKLSLIIAVVGLMFSIPTSLYALVSGGITPEEGRSVVSLKYQLETGFLKPSDDKILHERDADNQILQLSYARGINLFNFLSHEYLRLDLRSFEGPKEERLNQTIYDKDRGYQATMTLGGDFIHRPDFSLGAYINLSPYIDHNEEKFAHTRVDQAAIGLNLAMNTSAKWIFSQLIHVGSGYKNDQNAYLLLDSSMGYRINSKLIASAGLYYEHDLQSRVDSRYAGLLLNDDNDIATRKFGTHVVVNYKITPEHTLIFHYLEKIAGEFLTSTRALSLEYALSF